MNTMLKWIFFIGFFISVFIFWPNARVAYELPKVCFVSRWIEVMAIGVFFEIAKVRKEKLDPWLVGLTLLYLFVSLMSSALGSDLTKSIVGNYYRADGIITLLHLLILFFIITLLSNKSWLAAFPKVVSFSAIVLSGISVIQFLGNTIGIWSIGTWDGGYGHVFGNPNFLAGYLIVTMPFLAYCVDTSNNRKVKMFWIFSLSIQIIGIVLTNAWVGYFGIALFLSVWAFVKIKKVRLIIFLGGMMILGVLAFIFSNYQRSLETPVSINPESRQRIFMKSMLAIQEKPLLGYGWANFDKAFESVDYPVHMDQDVYVDKAHSSVLEVLVTTGVLGLIIYVLIIAKSFVNLYRKKELIYKYILFAFLLLVLHMQTNVISVSEEILFWIIAGFTAKRS